MESKHTVPAKVISIAADRNAVLVRTLDRIVAEGAAHAALIVTYPDGEQVVLRSTIEGDLPRH